MSDYHYNWTRLDEYPGLLVVDDLSLLPVGWADAQAGQLVYIGAGAHRGLFYTWDGSGWERRLPAGELVSVGVDGPTSTTSTSYVTVLTASTLVPIGRSVMVVASGPSVANSNGGTDLGIFRDSVSLMQWSQPGRSGSVSSYERPRPLSMVAFDIVHGSGGTVTTVNYTLQFKAPSDLVGTSTIGASADAQASITIIEI